MKIAEHAPAAKIAQKHDEKKEEVKMSHSEANDMVKKLGAVTISRPSLPKEIK